MFPELQSLGLTDNEQQIYLFLLANGASAASSISQKLRLHRTYTYDALERLTEKEIISTVRKEGKQQYQAARPELLAQRFKEQVKLFEDIIPKLQKLKTKDAADTIVEVHQGKRAYRTLMTEIIETKAKEVLCIGIDEDVLEQVEPIYLKQYLNNMQSRGIKERILVAKGKKKLVNKNITYRELESSVLGNILQEVYGDKVAIFIHGEPHTLIIIKNKQVADTYRAQFEILWKAGH